jgi:hypothetical protein
MKLNTLTILVCTLSIATSASAKDLFYAPVHLGNGTSHNGQPIHGSLPQDTYYPKTKVTKTPATPTHDAEDPTLTTPPPSTNSNVVTTTTYAPPPADPAAEPATPPTPNTPTTPETAVVAQPQTVPVTVTNPAPTNTNASNPYDFSATPAPTTTATTTPVNSNPNTVTLPNDSSTSTTAERAIPPPPAQLASNLQPTADAPKAADDNRTYSDKAIDFVKGMLGESTQPVDESLLRDEK